MSRGPTKPELESLTGLAAELYIQVRQGGSLDVGPTCPGTVQRYVKLCSGATETPLWDRPLKQGLQGGYSRVPAQTQLHLLTSYCQSRLYFIHVKQIPSTSDGGVLKKRDPPTIMVPHPFRCLPIGHSMWLDAEGPGGFVKKCHQDGVSNFSFDHWT